jgi:hypothetical protein
MIRPLRQRHRRAVFALGILLPVALVAGLAMRRPVPVVQSSFNAFTVEPPHLGQVLWERGDLWPQFSIRTRLFSDRGAGQKFAVELASAKEIVKPDLIVYWTPQILKAADSLPDDAVLLGALLQSTVTQLLLPDNAAKTSGSLLLYSLADHEVVAVSKPLEVGKTGISP